MLKNYTVSAEFLHTAETELSSEKVDALLLRLIRYALTEELDLEQYPISADILPFFLEEKMKIDAETKRQRGGAPKGNKNACKSKRTTKAKSRKPTKKKPTRKAQKAEEIVNGMMDW